MWFGKQGKKEPKNEQWNNEIKNARVRKEVEKKNILEARERIMKVRCMEFSKEKGYRQLLWKEVCKVNGEQWKPAVG